MKFSYHIDIKKVNSRRILILLIFILAASLTFYASYSSSSDSNNISHENNDYFDSPTTDLSTFFDKPNRVYHIQYNHETQHPINIPDSCTLSFEGGSIKASITFNKTRLSGQIKLNGSNISGSVINDIFNASWICNMDGETDDAKNINQIISVSDNIFFPKGDYYLKSIAQPSLDIPKDLQSKIKAHIGIHKSNLSLFGEDGTCFISSTPVVMICAYSCPNQIDNSISNLLIDNITFKEKNDKKNFHEFAHTIKLMGVNNCVIKDCKFDDFWGDGISLSHYQDNLTTGERTRNQNIKIINNYISGKGYNNRNGISVISGKNVSIIGNTIDQVSNKNMPGAIDIEGNNAAFTVEDISIINNKINGSHGTGGAISIVSLRDAPAKRILIDNNTITNSTSGMTFYIETNDCVSDVSIISNTINENTPPFVFYGKGRTNNWIVKDNNFKFNKNKFGGKIIFQNSIIE